MPIKFRCQHCRQFLGISRGKAGKIVDCPTCGRSIRVPHLDGRVEPLPQPKLNYEDESLVEALDALARIGDEGDEPVAIDEAALKGTGNEPVPLSEPVAKSAPAPVAVADPMPKVEPIPVDPAGARAPRSGDDPLAELGRETARAPHPTRSIPPSGWRRWIGVRGAAVVLPIAAAGFGIGLFVAGGFGGEDSRDDVIAEPNPRSESAEGGEANGAASEAPSLTGRIVYKSETGDQPDVGARVLALPETRTGSVKLPVVGFRPGDEAADFGVARAALQALGGDAAVVGEDGRYRATLPAAGTYRVLVLSRYRSRDVDEPLPGELQSLLDDYFERPNQLLGERRFELGEVRYRGTEPVTWGYTFPERR